MGQQLHVLRGNCGLESGVGFNIEFSIHADLIFLESSSLTGEGVDEGFMQCAKKIMTGIDSGMHSPWLSTQFLRVVLFVKGLFVQV